MSKTKEKALESDHEELRLEMQNDTKSIKLTPYSLFAFDWFKKHYNWAGDLSDFINDCVKYFIEKGLYAKILVEQEIFNGSEDQKNEQKLIQDIEKAIGKFKNRLEETAET